MGLATGDLRAGLAREDVEKVEVLVALCRAAEGLDLPIELKSGLEEGRVNQFVYYQGDEPVGIVSLYGDQEVELSGVVHPEWRRRGIGRALLEAALAECRRREAVDALLICEQASVAGAAFAAAVGGTLRFCEYRMELDPATRTSFERRHQQLTLEPAGPGDLDVLVDVTTRAFGDPEAEVQQRIERWLANPAMRFYIGRLKGMPIGALRLIFEERWTSIYTFGVVPEQRGQGYGRQMLSETVELLLVEQRREIALDVETENRKALGLYQSCGFRETTVYGYYALAL